ncbi:MAG: late competence development ComFB family protein, partial [bacterium]
MDFESIHNYYERPVFEAVTALAQKNTGTDQQIDAKYLADVACVALNQLLPRY